MDRNAYAASALDDGGTEPRRVVESQVRLLPEPAGHGQPSTTQDAAEASEHPVALLAPGTCVAEKYVICDVLGVGGSAVVYAAEQVNLRRVVAFKLYPARGALASTMQLRFEREAQLLARVNHENVVAVFDAGRMPDGFPYLVVQRLHGDSLAARLQAAGPLPVAEAVEVARQMLDALCALDEAGITHRDVKPENIVLDRHVDGRSVAKLVDFGIAKEAGGEASRALDEMVGTPGYMAPEQVRGEGIDARSDLYGLGATLYEMLAGRPPQTGETVQQVAMATLFGTIPALQALRPDCPEDLAQIVMRALAREPSDRFASAREMKSALDRWQAAAAADVSPGPAHEHEDIEDTLRVRTSDAPPRRPRRRREKRGLAMIACLAALGTFALAQALHGYPPASDVRGKAAAALALQANELAALELTAEARNVVGALAGRTSTDAAALLAEARASELVARARERAAELATRVHASARELLEALRSAAPAWGGHPPSRR